MEHEIFDTKSLAGMDPSDAFKQAFALSGLTQKQFMDRMNWRQDKTRRVFATGRYFPSFDELPKFCITVGNTIIIQWIQMNVLQGKAPIQYTSLNCQNLFARIGELFAEVGDVGQKGQEAVEDGEIDLGETRKMKKEVGEVMTKAIELMADLGALERELVEEKSKGE
ncbi:MAG: hypothetical protein CL942_08410 [Desulfovibrio sp.]|nr:hypothetical protein [Desulfovibrio sp.]|tara:strand:- start:15189 stop:15689 length:501 start_codon:yes stop_codon:yes gene_type:complete